MAIRIKPVTLLFGLPLIILLSFLSSCGSGERTALPEKNTLVSNGPSKEAIAEWNGQKYSMFIHFGLYSLTGGVWEGEKITKGYSEQIRAHGNISREEFRELAKEFNPTRWNADSVALLAKKAGMRSIVITSKHHDGFAMYHSSYSDFNIVDATPYKKDILKDLAAACEKHGLKFGVYFSLIDWDYPGAMPISPHNSDSIPPAHHQLNLNQVEELMTGYGPVSEIWFDMGKPSPEQSRELVAMVRKYQPDCLVSGRVWNDQGDFAVMGDNASPDFRMGTLWQTPASMFDETWGYRSWQERGDAGKKVDEKLRALINTVSNGGNYLLNIGPAGDGSIVAFEQEVLLAIGQWLETNGEAIYGITPAPLPEQDWGVLTHKPGKLFLFPLDGISEGELALKGMRSGIRSARLLTGQAVTIVADDAGTDPVLKIPAFDTKDGLPVIVVEYEGELEYVPSGVVPPTEAGNFVLSPDNAIKYHSYSGADYYSTRSTVISMKWHIRYPDAGGYRLLITSPATEVGKELELIINGKSQLVSLQGSSGANGKPGIQLDDIGMRPEMYNAVELRLADQSNPHRDMGIKGVVLKLAKSAQAPED